MPEDLRRGFQGLPGLAETAAAAAAAGVAAVPAAPVGESLPTPASAAAATQQVGLPARGRLLGPLGGVQAASMSSGNRTVQ